MSADKSKSEAEENLWRWISPLKNPDLTTENMLQIYTDWTKNAEYDDVSYSYIPGTGLDKHKFVNIFLPINFNICFGCSKEPSH